jgi:hypothetical protein
MHVQQMKYIVGDQVKFPWGDQILQGTIAIADFMGSLENDYHSYDISVRGDVNAGLYKHLPEADIIELVAPAPQEAFAGDYLDWYTTDGAYVITTASGSTYVLRLSKRIATLQRVNPNHQLRKDGTAIKVLNMASVQRGRSAEFTLEPLGAGPVTTRITSEITAIHELS